jgi:hypothetical protein
MMDLAVKTSASPVEIWAIVIVAVGCLVFWLSMVYRADRHQVRASGRTPGLPELDEARDEYDFSVGYEIPAQRVAEPVAAGASMAEDAPTRPDLPVQTGEPMPGMPAPRMPAQRSGEGDRAERSGTAESDRR